MQLAAYPFEIVNVACIYCTRKGRHQRSTLIKHHGSLPTTRLLEYVDCEPKSKKRNTTLISVAPQQVTVAPRQVRGCCSEA
jgi:hypothetical protein